MNLLKIIIACFLSLFITHTFAQDLDLNKPKDYVGKDKLFKMSGGLSASTIMYTGNEPYARDPFTYYLNGTVNFNIMGLIDLPFTVNLTNSGSNYAYPTLPNRLSVHPRYKWVTGHIGDVSMSFSPYTLNGHQFTGVGVDLNPESPFKVSAMYGRLLRPVEYDFENPASTPPTYSRMGYGTKVRYEKEKYQLGMTLFNAWDQNGSLNWKPDSLLIFPQQNVAMSWDVNVQLIENMFLNAEYGLSLMHTDINIMDNDTGTIYKTDQAFHALRVNLNYTFQKNTIGIGYERIDPGYKSLGAYYFNNDLENITLNYARPFLKDKGNIALSGGIQHDNIENDKETSTRRFVSSATVNYAPTTALNLSLAYSGYQTYMNLKSQFDYINQLTPYDNLDTLNYTQLSQSISLNTNYMFSRNEVRSQFMNLNLSFQQAADKQGDIIPEGASSLFLNSSLAYGIQFIPQQINLNASFNLTSNQMGNVDMLILGPTVSATGRFIKKKLTTGISLSYNRGMQNGDFKNEVSMLRLTAGYRLLKRNNFNLNALFRDNKTFDKPSSNGTTVTLSYSYAF